MQRGQLIMACGTGKTLTSLRLAEELCGRGGFVLFLAPSISLVSQSLRYWANQAREPLKAEAVCSDESASRSKEDAWENSLAYMPFPATTSAEELQKRIHDRPNPQGLTVIFSTYQSIPVVEKAQQLGMADFDFIICDEAHRTAGAQGRTALTEDVSNFVKIHDNNYIRGSRRLYMTATPKIFGDKVKRVAKAEDYVVSSMDNTYTFGPVMHRLSFGAAVSQNLLSDYRTLVLKISEDAVAPFAQRLQADNEGLDISVQARIIGCWKGLLNQGKDDGSGIMLHSAVAFCSTIPDSKRMADSFVEVVENYTANERALGHEVPHFACKTKHVDGTMDAVSRRECLEWLAQREFDESGNPVCHILFNVRCLSEGVDVPSLDAVIFMSPKKSQIDVIQAVGRVMRSHPDKKYGYIILPIAIPAGIPEDEALDRSEDFSVIWGVAKALRSHDERMEAIINSLAYDPHSTAALQVVDVSSMVRESPIEYSADRPQSEQLELDIDEHSIQRAVNARLVKKCGTRVYWEDWAKDIADISTKHIARIKSLVGEASPDQPRGKARPEFLRFLHGLRDSLNEGISEDEAMEMLAQHVITLPVFEALFKGHDFAKDNPVSQAMSQMLAVLQTHNLTNDKEKRELDALYTSVRTRCLQVTTDIGRQKLIKELYENFFRHAFMRTSEKMGIVYTPTEVVDYILYSADRLLYREFGQHLSDDGVHILDPFTGTGTFIQRLIANRELIPDERLEFKYKHELHCSEIMLLAYYIATINIEHAYQARGGASAAFPGAVLTDTFQMSEVGNTLDNDMFAGNTRRAVEQYALPVRVIIGNPPYSVGQRNANDNNANESYPTLDGRIAATYAAQSGAANKNALYDAYIRAFRWASDRIGDKGIVAFVTNAGWLRGGATAGFRRCLAEEFNSIYVYDLRGNQRTMGEQSRREGGKIFGSGSRAPIAITVLVKNPQSAERGKIYYHDIGDYLTQAEKLDLVRLAAKESGPEWTELHPDRHGDWLEQRDDSWYGFAPLGIEKLKRPLGLFSIWSCGIKTNRDVWSWNFSRSDLMKNIQRHIAFYEQERKRYAEEGRGQAAEAFVRYDEKRIKWNAGLLSVFKRNIGIAFDKRAVKLGLYRPFCQQWAYYEPNLIERTYQMPKLFPLNNFQRPDYPVRQLENNSSTDQLDNSCARPSLAENNSSQVLMRFAEPAREYEATGAEAEAAAEKRSADPNGAFARKADNLVVSMVGRNANKEFSCITSNCLPDLEVTGHG
ncbi:DEAD/DEAH box helicase, partial [bacterium]|nr:DEAD/DEAH box helicase [bacterium]